MTGEMDRRAFMVRGSLVGGGLAVGIAPGASLAATSPDSAPVEMTPWIVIAPDNTVTVRVATPEFGNGAMTQSVALVVEELECDWSQVKTEFASTNRDLLTYGVYTPIHPAAAFFGGRSTVWQRIRAMQQVGASARERLRQAAAARWSVPVADIVAEKGVMHHMASGRSLSYGELAREAASVKLASEPAIRNSDEWKQLGKTSPAKITIPSSMVPRNTASTCACPTWSMPHCCSRRCTAEGSNRTTRRR